MNCKKCNTLLEEKTHKILKDKLLTQPFFYLRWYICPNCGWRIQFEKDKIFNKTTHYKEIKVMRKLNLIK